jgi:hypothetical protein
MAREVMLTTIDNPFDPFTDYEAWYAWDHRSGYHSPGVLAAVAVTSDELSETEFLEAIEDAIDYIVEENISGVHKKVVKEE